MFDFQLDIGCNWKNNCQANVIRVRTNNRISCYIGSNFIRVREYEI